MRWILFNSGIAYTLASDIQKEAESHGYAVPCDADGTRHPGSDCNRKMRSICKNVGMRRTFGLKDDSVIDVSLSEGEENELFLRWLVDEGYINSSYLKKGCVHLYTIEAVNSLLSSMLGVHVEYQKDGDEESAFSGNIVIRSHNLEFKKNKPKASLFRK